MLSLIFAAALAVAVWFVIGQAASYPRLLHALHRANGWWLSLAAAGTGIGYLGYALLYRVFSGLDDGPRPSLRLVLRLTVAIFGASVIATSAGRLGTEYWGLRRLGEKPAFAWSRVLALNTAAWAILAALGSIGAAALLLGAAHRLPLGIEVVWLLALPLCCAPALYLSSPARRGLAADRGSRPRRLLASVVRSLIMIRSAAGSTPARTRTIVGGLLYWGGEVLIVWGALRAFGVALGPAPLVIGYATGFVSTMLPLPAGGAGGVDAASTYALTLVGVPLGPALLATLVQRLFSYWLPVVIAGASIRSISRLGGDLNAVPRLATAGKG